MNKIAGLILLGIASQIAFGGAVKKFEQVNFSQVKIDDGFWSPRLKTLSDVTIPVCMDKVDSRYMHNFINASSGGGTFEGLWFDDGIVYGIVQVNCQVSN